MQAKKESFYLWFGGLALGAFLGVTVGFTIMEKDRDRLAQNCAVRGKIEIGDETYICMRADESPQ